MIIKPAEGHGQSECKRCKEKGKWSLTWTSFLYKIRGEEGLYCYDCIKEIDEERNTYYKQRMDKATNYYLHKLAENKSMPDEAVKMFNYLEGNIR